MKVKKKSAWFSTPQSMRHRKALKLSLSVGVLSFLRDVSEALNTSQSAFVERLLLKEQIRLENVAARRCVRDSGTAEQSSPA